MHIVRNASIVSTLSRAVKGRKNTKQMCGTRRGRLHGRTTQGHNDGGAKAKGVGVRAYGRVPAVKAYLYMASTAKRSHRSMLNTLPARGWEMLRMRAKRLMVRLASMGTVLTNVMNDRPLPARARR